MQITFDPLVPAEAAYVRKIMGTETQTLTVDGVSAELTVDQMANLLRAGIQVAEQEDPSPQATAALRSEMLDRMSDRAAPASAAPLPPAAPLPAAADLFATAPVAPPAGEASAPIVPPPPVPPVPAPVSAPRATALPVIPADAVDKHGLPWDERIHSGTKVKNADGSWRQRRGVDEALVKTVETELRALMAIEARPGVALESGVPLDVPSPPPPIPALAETVSSAPVTSTTEPLAAHGASTAVVTSDAGNVPPPPVPAPPTSAPATAPIPTPPTPPAPIAADGTAPRISFAALMLKLSGAVRERKITTEQVNAGLGTVGLLPTQMAELSTRTDLINPFDDYLTALGVV